MFKLIVDLLALDLVITTFSSSSASLILSHHIVSVNWTIRDFYTLGEEFAYVALVQKADIKVRD